MSILKEQLSIVDKNMIASCNVNEFEAHKIIHAIAGNDYQEVTKACLISIQNGVRQTGWDLNEMKDYMLNQVSGDIAKWIVLSCIYDAKNIEFKHGKN